MRRTYLADDPTTTIELSLCFSTQKHYRICQAMNVDIFMQVKRLIIIGHYMYIICMNIYKYIYIYFFIYIYIEDAGLRLLPWRR